MNRAIGLPYILIMVMLMLDNLNIGKIDMESTTFDGTSDLNSTEYATATDPMLSAFIGTYSLVILVIAIVAIVALWKVFTKAGKPGWAAIIPFYNVYVMLQIVGRPSWWLLLFFIPLINIVISVVLALDIAKSFGRSSMFGILANFILSPIGYLIIGFGSAQYVGPAAATGGPTPPAAPMLPTTPPQNPQAPQQPTPQPPRPPQTPPAGSL